MLRSTARAFCCLCVSILLAGCAAPADTGAVLSDDETSTAEAGGGGVAVNQETTTLADSLFNFDPTIDPAATPEANAASIARNTEINAQGCGSISVSDATVSVDFGAAPGCVLASGAQIAGVISVGVSKSGNTTTIALGLTNVVVNGQGVSGTASFATTTGSTFTVSSSLVSNGKTVTSSVTVTGGANSFALSGTSKVVEGGTTTTLTFNNLTHVKGECYASSGSVTIAKGGTTETMTFTAPIPQTGQVSVQVGRRTTTTTLPPYGDCPGGTSTPDAGTAGHDAGRRDAGR
jgi:hypothetical protein